MEIYHYIAICSVLVQGVFIYTILKQYGLFKRTAITSEEIDIINDEIFEDSEFDESDIITESKRNLFSDLRWNTAHSSGLEFVEKNVYRFYSLIMNTVNHYGNLGPAFGLIFTFLGMILTFGEISNSNISDESHVKTIILSMSPVIIGSLFGIITYAIARIADNKIAKHVDLNVIEITEVLKQYDDESIPENIEDAYGKILNSLTDLRSELKGVTRNISNYSDTMNASNKTYENSVENLGNMNVKMISDFNDSKDLLLASNADISQKFGIYASSIDSAKSDISGLFDSLGESTKFMKDLMDHGISFTKSVKLSGEAITTLIETTDSQHKASENLIEATNNFSKIQTEIAKVTLDIKEIHETSQSVAGNIESISKLFPVNTFNDMRMHLQSIMESIEKLIVSLDEKKVEKQPMQPAISLSRSDGSSLGGDTKFIENLLKQQLVVSNDLMKQLHDSDRRNSRFRNIFLPIGLFSIILAIVLTPKFETIPQQVVDLNEVTIDSLVDNSPTKLETSDLLVDPQ
jgi:hypothetical protein